MYKRQEEVNSIGLSDNIEFIELNKRVNNLEKAFKEILCVQSGSKAVSYTHL